MYSSIIFEIVVCCNSSCIILSQSIKGTKKYFEPNFLANSKYDFIKIVGSYSSIIEKFADVFEANTNNNQQENILSEIFKENNFISKEFLSIGYFTYDIEGKKSFYEVLYRKMKINEEIVELLV